eukprot:gene12523-biopygen21483
MIWRRRRRKNDKRRRRRRPGQPRAWHDTMPSHGCTRASPLGKTAADARGTRRKKFVLKVRLATGGRAPDARVAVSPWGNRTLARAWRGQGAGMSGSPGEPGQGPRAMSCAGNSFCRQFLAIASATAVAVATG